jgi:hypothetical protein
MDIKSYIESLDERHKRKVNMLTSLMQTIDVNDNCRLLELDGTTCLIVEDNSLDIMAPILRNGIFVVSNSYINVKSTIRVKLDSIYRCVLDVHIFTASGMSYQACEDLLKGILGEDLATRQRLEVIKG